MREKSRGYASNLFAAIYHQYWLSDHWKPPCTCWSSLKCHGDQRPLPPLTTLSEGRFELVSCPRMTYSELHASLVTYSGGNFVMWYNCMLPGRVLFKKATVSSPLWKWYLCIQLGSRRLWLESWERLPQMFQEMYHAQMLCTCTLFWYTRVQHRRLLTAGAASH